MTPKVREFSQTFFHGTKADLKVGDEIIAGLQSNYVEETASKFNYVTSNLHVAVWGAELAVGTGRERIYVVEPTGEIEDDPNVTNKRFPGNPTRSYRTRDPLTVMGEVMGWQGHAPEEIQARREGIAKLFRDGAKIIED